MNLKDKNLIQVKSLQQKHANQIEKVAGSWHPKWRQFWEAIQHSKPEVELLYWTNTRLLDGMPDGARVWLIRVDNKHLYWILAPDSNHEYAQFGKDLEQLFID